MSADILSLIGQPRALPAQREARTSGLANDKERGCLGAGKATRFNARMRSTSSLQAPLPAPCDFPLPASFKRANLGSRPPWIRKMSLPSAMELPLNTTDLPVLPRLDARLPKWSLTRLLFRSCPFCQTNSEPLPQRPDRLPVAFCNNCYLRYVSSLPPTEVHQLYRAW